ncbi:hypothetical protein HDZ31DRAFT_76618 [Schizophyllum fasciatum]
MVKQRTNKQQVVLGDAARRERSSPGPSRAAFSTDAGSNRNALPGHIPKIRCSDMADLIRTIQEKSGLQHRPTYDIESSDIGYSKSLTPSLILARTIVAPRLKVLILRGNNSQVLRQRQHTALLRSLSAHDLEKFAFLRPGMSTKLSETQVYDFLTQRTSWEKLKSVSLNMRFIYKDGIKRYLKSFNAAHLTTLRLRTNTNIQSCLIEALVTGYKLRSLRTLTIRVKNLVPSELIDALEARYHSLGDDDVLTTVEVSVGRPLTWDIIERARRIGITLSSVPS